MPALSVTLVLALEMMLVLVLVLVLVLLLVLAAVVIWLASTGYRGRRGGQRSNIEYVRLGQRGEERRVR